MSRAKLISCLVSRFSFRFRSAWTLTLGAFSQIRFLEDVLQNNPIEISMIFISLISGTLIPICDVEIAVRWELWNIQARRGVGVI